MSIFYMNAKNWESKDMNWLLRVLVENKIHEHKDNKIKHPFYDDELENMLEEDIHNISYPTKWHRRRKWMWKNINTMYFYATQAWLIMT